MNYTLECRILSSYRPELHCIVLVRNPFEQQPPNPFQAAKAPKPAMNDLLQQRNTSGWTQQSTQPTQEQTDLNPFF